MKRHIKYEATHYLTFRSLAQVAVLIFVVGFLVGLTLGSQ